MPLTWKNKIDNIDTNSAEDVNILAAAIKENEDGIAKLKSDKVDKTTTINDKPLNSNIKLAGADVPVTGYKKAASKAAIAEADTVNEAFGKLEAGVEENSASISELQDESTLPHGVKDVTDNKTYKMGLQIKDGKTQIVYEEVV